MRTKTKSKSKSLIVSAKLPGEMAEQFDAFCQKNRISRNYVIKELIRITLEEASERQKRQK